MLEELPIEATITRVELTRDEETGEHHLAAYAGDTLVKSSAVTQAAIDGLRGGGPLQFASYNFGGGRWIPVKERMPVSGAKCVIAWWTGLIQCFRIAERVDGEWVGPFGDLYSPDFWMPLAPLPEPPTREQ